MQYVRLSRKNLSVFVLLILMCAMSPAWAGSTDRVSKNALANMPVKEVTVFKDGHAFVLHEGPMPTDAEGNVVLDYLPTPIVGTFWSYSAQTDVKLTGVVSGKRRRQSPGCRGRTRCLRVCYFRNSDPKLAGALSKQSTFESAGALPAG